MVYHRPRFKCVVKRLCFRVFKEIANSIIAFLARLDSSHVRNTLIGNSMIANRGGGGGGGGGEFTFAFIASLHLNVGLRYTPMSPLLMQDCTEQTYDVTQHGKPQPKLVTPDANYGQLEHVSIYQL